MKQTFLERIELPVRAHSRPTSASYIGELIPWKPHVVKQIVSNPLSHSESNACRQAAPPPQPNAYLADIAQTVAAEVLGRYVCQQSEILKLGVVACLE